MASDNEFSTPRAELLPLPARLGCIAVGEGPMRDIEHDGQDPYAWSHLVYETHETERGIDTTWQKRLVMANGQLVHTPVIPGQPAGPVYDKRLFEEKPLRVPFELTGECAERTVEVPSLLDLPDPLAVTLGNTVELPGSLQVGMDIPYRTVTTKASYVDTNTGNLIDVTTSQLLDYAVPGRAVIRIDITPQQDGPLTLHTGITNTGRPNASYLTKQTPDPEASADSPNTILTYDATTISGQEVVLAQKTIMITQAPTGMAECVSETDDAIWRSLQWEGEADRTYSIAVVSGVAAREHHEPPRPQLRQESIALIAATPPIEEIVNQHRAALAERWQQCATIISGDPEWQKSLWFNQGHLIAHAGKDGTYPQQEPKINNPEGGGYGGRGFWDGYIFATAGLPRAQQRAMLAETNRFVDAARYKAHTHGYAGGWFVWESTRPTPPGIDGEACPADMPTESGRFVPVRTYREAIHSSADVVFANMKYVRETGDTSLLWEAHGAEASLEAVRFLASRATKRDDGSYVYEHVAGPDEWHEDVTNNAFTVLMAKHAFHMVIELAESSPDARARMDALREQIGLTDTEWAHMLDVSANLHIPFDPNTLVISAFEGWDELQPLDFQDPRLAEVKNLDEKMREIYPIPPAKSASELTLDELNPIRRFKAVKQDDVLLALVLLRHEILHLLPQDTVTQLTAQYGSKDALLNALYARNYDEYAPVTRNLSSLSPGTAAMAALLAGKPPDVCYALGKKSVHMDLDQTNPYETGQGIHTANAGSSVMLTKDGYMGIAAVEGTLVVFPRMPSHWEAATTRVEYFGHTLEITVNQTQKTISTEVLDATNQTAIPVWLNGHARTLTADHSRAMA